jgi:hypothetical protein
MHPLHSFLSTPLLADFFVHLTDLKYQGNMLLVAATSACRCAVLQEHCWSQQPGDPFSWQR